MNSIYIYIIILPIPAVLTTALAFNADHIIHYDSIPITANFEHEIESFLNYARDYVTTTASFLIEKLEESTISKHKDYPTTTAYFSYNTVEDMYSRIKDKDQLRVDALIEITVDSDNSNDKEA